MTQSKYRIKIVEENRNIHYFPQRRVLGVFWVKLLVECGSNYDLYYCTTKERALAIIENDKRQREKYPKKVEYEYVD